MTTAADILAKGHAAMAELATRPRRYTCRKISLRGIIGTKVTRIA